MRSSFLDDRNFPLHVAGMLISFILIAFTFSACSQPRTPEEKIEQSKQYSEHLKEDMTIVSPRPGVECYVIRGYSSANPRVMSCVGTVPTTMGQ